MDEYSKKQVDERKKAVFDSMAIRHQKRILKKGYDKWDPFMEPKDPIDIRKDKTKRTSQQLIREFLQSSDHQPRSNAYARGAFELCLGIINEDEKCQGMFAFACWYHELLKMEGMSESEKE